MVIRIMNFQIFKPLKRAKFCKRCSKITHKTNQNKFLRIHNNIIRNLILIVASCRKCVIFKNKKQLIRYNPINRISQIQNRFQHQTMLAMLYTQSKINPNLRFK